MMPLFSRRPARSAPWPWLAALLIVLGLALALVVAPAARGGTRLHLSGYSGGSGGGSTPLRVVVAAPTVSMAVAPTPALAPPAAATPAPAPPVAAAGDEPAILDNPNNHPPADLDPNRPYGPPVVRTDWVISKDYAAHGGTNPIPNNQWGAIDFAYWYNKDAFGSPIVATHAGKVHLIPNDAIYGNWVWVVNDHFGTRYGHTQKYLVQEGQAVVRGTVLAEMGSTGNSTGPHVDYQVWEDGVNKNPMNYLK